MLNTVAESLCLEIDVFGDRARKTAHAISSAFGLRLILEEMHSYTHTAERCTQIRDDSGDLYSPDDAKGIFLTLDTQNPDVLVTKCWKQFLNFAKESLDFIALTLAHRSSIPICCETSIGRHLVSFGDTILNLVRDPSPP